MRLLFSTANPLPGGVEFLLDLCPDVADAWAVAIPGHDVYVGVEHLLSGHGAGIGDHRDGVSVQLLLQQASDVRHGRADLDEDLVIIKHICRVSPGDDEGVPDLPRLNVEEGKGLRILVHLSRRDPSGDDLTKQAVHTMSFLVVWGASSEAHDEARVCERRLHIGDGQGSVVEDAGGEQRVGSHSRCVDEVLDAARSSGGDQWNGYH